MIKKTSLFHKQPQFIHQLSYMKKHYILIIIFLLTLGASAQNREKHWEEGKLTWQDFQERKVAFNQSVSEIKYFIGYKTEKEKLNDTVFIRLKSYSYIDPTLSWVNPDYKTDKNLKYNQVIFDIAELYRRELQYDLDRLNSAFDAEVRFQRKYQELNQKVEEFQRLSNYGNDEEIIDQWKVNISEKLDFYVNNQFPRYKKVNFGIGINAGIGSSFQTGSLKEHFGPSLSFVYGFDFAIKNSMLYLNGTLSGGKVDKNYSGKTDWLEKQKYRLAIIDITYGYAIIDNAKFKLVPFAGLGITEFSDPDYDAEENDLRIVDYNIAFGINADYKIRQRLSTVPNLFFGHRDMLETSIRTRLYIAKNDFYTDLNGYSINLSIGVSWFGKMLKLE